MGGIIYPQVYAEALTPTNVNAVIFETLRRRNQVQESSSGWALSQYD